MAPGIPGIPNDVQGPAPDAPFNRSPRCRDTSDEPENSLTQNTRFCPTNCSRPTPATEWTPWSIGSAQVN